MRKGGKLEGWKVVKFGDVCDFVRGPFGGSLKKEIFVEDGFAVYEQQHAIYNQFEDIRYFIDSGKFDEMKRFEVKPGNLIMSCSGTMGKVAIVPGDVKKGIINQALLLIKPSKSILNTFIKYWMESESFQEGLREFSQGAAIQNVASVKILKEIDITVPPLSEQQRIVSVLDEAFASIAQAKSNAERNLVNARELFESVLQYEFENAGKSWEEKRLGDATHLITDGKHGDCRDEENSGYYFLSAKDVKYSTLNYEKARQIKKEDFEETHRRTNLKPGDVLVTNSGTIGRMAIAPDDAKTYKTTFQKSVAIIKPIPSMLDNVFCCYHLKADLSKLVNVSAGTAQKNLLIGDLKNHLIKIPPLAEQRAIVGRLEALSAETGRLEEIYQQKVESLEELKKSVLGKAFEGEL